MPRTLAVLVIFSVVGLIRAPRTTATPQATADLTSIHTISAETPVDIQIAIARAAGPPVSAKATIYVLGRTGYVRAVGGSNGFTCLITRDRLDAMAPECYDAAGTASEVPVQMFIEEQRAHGLAEPVIAAAVEARYRSGAFMAPARPGICYMLSANNYLADPDSGQIIHFPGHLMFYAPNLTSADVGEGPGAPLMTNPGHPDNMMVVVPASSHPHSAP
jgi:hypothetical protein